MGDMDTDELLGMAQELGLLSPGGDRDEQQAQMQVQVQQALGPPAQAQPQWSGGGCGLGPRSSAPVQNWAAQHSLTPPATAARAERNPPAVPAVQQHHQLPPYQQHQLQQQGQDNMQQRLRQYLTHQHVPQQPAWVPQEQW
jgi:hypothetical protein